MTAFQNQQSPVNIFRAAADVQSANPGWGSLSVTTKALIGVVAVLGAAALAAPFVAMLGRKMYRKRRKHAAKAGRRKDAGRSSKAHPGGTVVTSASRRRPASALSARSQESSRNVTKETGHSDLDSTAEALDVPNLAALRRKIHNLQSHYL
eukprot:GHVT01013537.1.p2 GENE.GHVT01013537.1~~GHVT01013537.1.p2  ORF type:complete len:151 (-),score=18.23 GHVT01013537.1:677-1129(-)